MDWSNPWDIIGWGVIGYVVLTVVVIAGAIASIYIRGLLSTRRNKRANAGKLKCDFKGCDLKAAYRTPLGLFCDPHSQANSEKKTISARISFRMPLEYIKKARQ